MVRSPTAEQNSECSMHLRREEEEGTVHAYGFLLLAGLKMKRSKSRWR